MNNGLATVLGMIGGALISVGILGFVVAVMFGLIAAVFVMLLWNGCLVGAVSGVSEIGFLQAWGLYILCALLFKSSSYKTKG